MRAPIFLVVILAVLGSGPAAAEAPPRLLAFYPQAGLLGRDLHVTNHLDLDPGPGVRDYDCGTRSYDGHTGQDTIVRSFREVRIGVPVFAAFDGHVVSVQRAVGGDFNWGPTVSAFDNHVVLDHGDGQQTVYGHLAGGIALRRGQWVPAGTQIGRTASSGNSSWPHLHFTIRRGWDVFEPFAGPCREGASGWERQPELSDEAYVADVALSARPFTGRADLPWDEAVRTGTFVRGRRDVHVRVELRNPEAAGSGRLTVLRPDGSTAAAGSLTVSGRRAGWAKRRLRLDLARTGRWRLVYALDGRVVAEAPFDVVASARAVRNRPPSPIGVALEPEAPRAGQVVLCTVATSLVTEDPDYAIVRYRYRWTAGARVVRDVTSAALSDAIPNTAVRPGETLTCTVTPSDGVARGPAAAASATLPG